MAMTGKLRNKFLAQMVEAGYVRTPRVEVRLNMAEPTVFRPMFKRNIGTGEVLVDRRPEYLRTSEPARATA